MRVLLSIVLLSILLCVQPAHSLKCYNCTGIKQSSQCNIIQCGASATHCGNLEAADKEWKDNEKIYFKGCTSSCEGLFKELVDKAHIAIPSPRIEIGYQCCLKDLCNAADGIRGSPLALIGAFLLSFGPVLWAMV